MKQTTVTHLCSTIFWCFAHVIPLKKTPGDFGRSTLVELHQRKNGHNGAYYNQQLFRWFP